MSMEASAGKHPVAHVGKTYHCMAHDIAVQLLDDVDPGRVADVVEACLSDWGGVRGRLLAGSYELF
jgi:S-adenosylmethionine synthetase